MSINQRVMIGRMKDGMMKIASRLYEYVSSLDERKHVDDTRSFVSD